MGKRLAVFVHVAVLYGHSVHVFSFFFKRWTHYFKPSRLPPNRSILLQRWKPRQVLVRVSTGRIIPPHHHSPPSSHPHGPPTPHHHSITPAQAWRERRVCALALCPDSVWKLPLVLCLTTSLICTLIYRAMVCTCTMYLCTGTCEKVAEMLTSVGTVSYIIWTQTQCLSPLIVTFSQYTLTLYPPHSSVSVYFSISQLWWQCQYGGWAPTQGPATTLSEYAGKYAGKNWFCWPCCPYILNSLLFFLSPHSVNCKCFAGLSRQWCSFKWTSILDTRHFNPPLNCFEPGATGNSPPQLCVFH